MRWDSSGTLLVSGCNDETAKVVDLKTGKTMHMRKNPYHGKLQNLRSHSLIQIASRDPQGLFRLAKYISRDQEHIEHFKLLELLSLLLNSTNNV